MKKIVNFVKKIFGKILSKIKSKQKAKQELSEKELLRKLLIEDFNKKFGFDHKNVIKLINNTNNLGPSFINDNASYSYEYHSNELVKGRKHINSISKKPVFHYDPVIVDIHNEVKDLNNVSLNNLILSDNEESKEMIKRQERKLRFEDYPEKKKKRIKKILGLIP